MGRSLLLGVEAEVRRRGGRLMLIETSGTTPYARARRLYETSGYRHEAVIHDFYAPGDDLHVYAKEMAVA